MSPFGFSKKKEEVIAVFDIGSASVGGMIVKSFLEQPERKPQIITSARVPVNFLLDVNFEAFWRCTGNALKKVVTRLSKISPDKVLCVFSSPWFISQTRIIKVKREEPFEITDDFLKKLIANEIKIFKSQWQAKMGHSLRERADDGPELIEYDTMKVSLNGYRTSKPLGKKTKTLDVHIYISLGIKTINKEIKKIISENFGNVDINFHTLPITAFSVLENVIKPEGGYIFADVGGEVSDISLARNNILEETISFPMGRNNLVRDVAAKFKTFINEAPSLIERYENGRMNPSDSEKISSIIEKVKKDWRAFLHKSLVEISDNGPLPQNFFLINDGGVSAEFVGCAKDNSFSKFTILGKPFKVQQVLPGSIKHFFKFKKSFEEDKDVFLMMEFLYFNQIYNKQ